MALHRNPDLTQAFLDLDHEIACHSWRWIHYQHMSETRERRHIEIGTQIIKDLTKGQWPLGWYTGRDSPNTKRLVADHGGYEYDSDYYGDDLPFWMPVEKSDGTTIDRLIVPYTLDTNDMRFASMQGFNTGDHFFHYLRDAFDVLYEEGAETPKMMSIGMHCRILGRPGRFKALQRFLDHVQQHDRVWVCRRVDIARHWAATHPGCLNSTLNPETPMASPLTLAQLNTATAAEFAALLDGHLRAFAVDRREGLRRSAPFNARSRNSSTRLVTVLRDAGPEAQVALIRAHPELAGKAMVAKTLTAESTNEQGKAGLTDCTPAEFAHIQTLNAAYNGQIRLPVHRWPCAARADSGLGRGRRSSTPSRDASMQSSGRRVRRVPCAPFTASPKFSLSTIEFGTVEPTLGNQACGLPPNCSRSHSDPGFGEKQAN